MIAVAPPRRSEGGRSHDANDPPRWRIDRVEGEIRVELPDDLNPAEMDAVLDAVFAEVERGATRLVLPAARPTWPDYTEAVLIELERSLIRLGTDVVRV